MSVSLPKLSLCAGLALALARVACAQTEIRLWPGAAPGSERWSNPEAVATSPSGDRILSNVKDPSVTVFLPDASAATGAAVVIAPGGALRVLAIDDEGVKGGGVAVGTVLAPKSDASPDFLVSLYGPSLQDVDVPAHAPPLFVAVGSAHFNVTNGCLALFAAWKADGKPAEIHVYDGVSAGFGMRKLGLPVDGWTDRLYEWLVERKLTSPVSDNRN
jgi:hypothetical protein